jgi:fructan beta-fructosidase
MAVYDESANKQWIAFHTSPDLKKWTFQSHIDGYFECPDIFELPVDGDQGESKWVLYAANGEYALGEFDGKTFKPDGPKQRLWYGNFYAAQSFSNTPDGRRIQIGWGQGIEFPDQPFNQQMTIPVELKLKKFDDGLKMTAMPVQELAVRNGVVFRDQEILETQVIPFDRNRLPIERSMPIGVSLSCADPGTGSLRLEVLGEPVLINFEKKTIKVCDAPPAPWSPIAKGEPKIFSARFVVDRGSVEAFVGDGRTAISARAKPEADAPIAVLTREGDPLHVEVQAGEIPAQAESH